MVSTLPEECLAHILSLTSPEDVLRSAAVSKQFYCATVSDAVWKKFLPSDYDQIISQSSTPVEFNSLKDLCLLLYRSHILIDQNTKSFSLDRRSCRKCYMLGSRSLAIVWGDTPEYWGWEHVHESRFPENAKLRSVCWLHIKGEIPTRLLSQNTTYGAYFVFKLPPEDSMGFENVPVQVLVSERNENEIPFNDHHPMATNSFYLQRSKDSDSEEEPEQDLPLPLEREDGWMEIEMGTHRVGIQDRAASQRVSLVMILREIEVLNWKDGLIVQGIELRPLD